MTEFEKLAKRLNANDISSEIIRLNEWLVDSLKDIDSIENLENFERIDRNVLFQDLAHIERGVPKRIAERLQNHLNSKDTSHCAILLRAGSLFPFVHLSSLLALLEGRVDCITIVPYPGSDGELLDDKGQQTKRYYRGEIV